jgi:undecaprenyl-diphosphatase
VIAGLVEIDKSLFLAINSLNAEWLNPLMVFFSGQTIWLPFLVLICWFAYKQLDLRTFILFCLFLILAVIASDVSSSYILKNVVQRLRPCRLDEIKPILNNFGQKCGGRYGFVSSHAANSFCLLIFSFLTLNLKSWKFHILWALAIVVSYSRIYLGVHYPGDIIGGILVGAGWSFIMAKLFRLRRQTT